MRISDWSSDVCSSDLGSDLGQLDALWAAGQNNGATKEGRSWRPETTVIIAGQVGGMRKRGESQAFVSLEDGRGRIRSEEHTSELQSLMRISYDVFCLKKKNT